MAQFSPDRLADGIDLSPLEAAILLEVARGSSNAAIARRRGVTPTCVMHAINRVRGKIADSFPAQDSLSRVELAQVGTAFAAIKKSVQPSG